MKIRHERPISDLSFQVRAPLGLELATGERVTIEKWSLQGFEFPADVDVPPREALLSIPFQGVDIQFPVRLERVTGSKELNFQGLTGRQRETLAVFYRSILSGKMASTEEVITSLDTPVDLVPMGETEEEKVEGAQGKSPRSLRAAFSVTLYVLLAVLVFWTLGTGIYAKLSQVPIKTARVEAPLVPHLAAQNGFVKSIQIAPGQTVSVGDVLVQITSPDSERDLSEVRSRIDVLEQRLAVTQTRERRLEDRIVAKEREVLDRIGQLPASEWRAAEAELANFEAQFEAENADLFNAYRSAKSERDTITEELRRLRRERGRLRDAADALHIVATQDGVVSKIAVLKGQAIGRGSLAVVVENASARVVRGWVSSDMSAALSSGMDVSVRYNARHGPQQIDGTVESLVAGVDPELSPEFGTFVTIIFPSLSIAQTRQTLPHLMPVDVRIKRAWAVRFTDTLNSLRTSFRG